MPYNPQELSLPDKEAVRTYIYSELGPKAFALSLVMFILGYFIKDLAQGKAEADATRELQRSLAIIYRDAAQEAQKAKDTAAKAATEADIVVKSAEKAMANAESAQTKAESSLGNAKEMADRIEATLQAATSAAQQVERIHSNLNTLETFKQSGEIVDAVVRNLREDRGFLSAIANASRRVQVTDIGDYDLDTNTIGGKPTSWQKIANLELSIESTGRPILLMLIDGFIQPGINGSRDEDGYLEVRITKNGTNLTTFRTGVEPGGSTDMMSLTIPASAMSYIDLDQTAGQRIYAIEARILKGEQARFVGKLAAFEL